MNRFIKYLLFVAILSNSMKTFCQKVMTLDDVLTEAINKSFESREANSRKELAYFEYKLYKSQLKPQVSFDVLLPNFINSTKDVTQPNGTIAFQSITQNDGSLLLNVNQEIPFSGGQIFMQSGLQRFDDFNDNSFLYNGSPFRIGIIQPLFGYNPYKYSKKIQPLILEESIKKYNIDIENTQLIATQLYFEVIIAKENQNIALTNKIINEKLLSITNERFELGKVTRDEKLQLQIELQNSILSSKQAEYEYSNALSNLFIYLGDTVYIDEVELKVPQIMNDILIDVKVLERKAIENKPEFIAFKKRSLEAKEEISKQKTKYGIRANIIASYGLSKSSARVNDVYQTPNNEQLIRLSVSMPLIDWGKRKTAVKMAEINSKNEQDRMAQEEIEFKNEVKQIAQRFIRLQSDLTMIESILSIANERSEISNNRYILGDINITDLTLAQREKNQSQRQYISTLKDYYIEYYKLRAFTGYDFRKNQNIKY